MRTILTFLLTAACALSDPAWKADLSPAKPGAHPALPPSTMDFTLSWKGMLKAGKVRMEFAPKGARKPGAMVIKSTASSQGAASKLYPYSHSYWSEIDQRTLASRYFHSTESDSKETTVTTNRYSSRSVDVRESGTKRKSGAATTEAYSFPHGPARDVYSAILHVRSQKLDPGDEHTLLLLPFKTPYLLKVRVEAKEKHHGRDALRISFGLRKIDRNTYDLVPYKKLKKPVTLWLSDDADRIPLELRAAVYIGDVRAVLTDFRKLP
jgi:hypothetical protein